MKSIDYLRTKIATIVVLFICTAVAAQHRLPVNGEKMITYRGEFALDSISSDQMSEKAVEWLRAHYFSSEVVRDETDESYVVRGFFKMPDYNTDGTMFHECRLKLDDGKYTYMFHNFIYTEPGGVSFQAETYPEGWKGDKRFYELLNNEVVAMVEDLQKYMAQDALAPAT